LVEPPEPARNQTVTDEETIEIAEEEAEQAMAIADAEETIVPEEAKAEPIISAPMPVEAVKQKPVATTKEKTPSPPKTTEPPSDKSAESIPKSVESPGKSVQSPPKKIDFEITNPDDIDIDDNGQLGLF
jgi:topoisomerase-4 subunit A